MRRQHDGLTGELDDRRQFLQRIDVHLVDVRVAAHRVGRNQDRIAIGCAPGSGLDADIAIGAGLVLDHDLLMQAARQCSPTRRAPTSVEPPAGNGTMKRIGRFGHSCAFVVGMATTRARNATTRRNFTIGKWSRSPYGSLSYRRFPWPASAASLRWNHDVS